MFDSGISYGWQSKSSGSAVRWIIIITIGVFFIQSIVDSYFVSFSGRGAFSDIFGLSASGLARGRIWQLGSYIFLHSGLWHIFLNMLMLFMFGREVEEELGSKRFFLLYLASGILGGIGWVLITSGSAYYCVGASGATFGIMGAFAAMFPYRKITLLVLFVIPVTMTARMMAIGLAAFTLFSMVSGQQGNIAHMAHLAGGIAGYIYGLKTLQNGRTGAISDNRFGKNLLTGFMNWFSTKRTESKRKRFRVVSDIKKEPDAETVDKILDKIMDKGIGSLNHEERDLLDRASKKSN